VAKVVNQIIWGRTLAEPGGQRGAMAPTPNNTNFLYIIYIVNSLCLYKKKENLIVMFIDKSYRQQNHAEYNLNKIFSFI
jgi:hypothetical protein